MSVHGGASSSMHGMAADGSGGTSTMPMSTMQMVFFTSNMTPLYSMDWSPPNSGSYTGTCIFLIVLAALFRGLMPGKNMLEHRWLAAAHARPAIVIHTNGGAIVGEKDANTVVVSREGSQDSLRPLPAQVAARSSVTIPWRLSVDLPRALYMVVLSGVGYLL